MRSIIALLFVAAFAGCASDLEDRLESNPPRPPPTEPAPTGTPTPPDDETTSNDAGSAPPVAPTLPAGRANWVVANGTLVPKARDNVVRVGTYAFEAASKTVTARMWSWSQTKPVLRVGTGNTPAGGCAGGSGVRPCEILTAQGFADAPNDVRTGAFELLTGDDGRSVVAIRWNTTPEWTEEWFVDENPDKKFAAFTFKESTRAGLGHGYGSNASLDTRRAMSSVEAHRGELRYAYTIWAHDVLTTRGAAPFNIEIYGQCTTTSWVLTYRQPSSETSCKAGCVAPYSSDTSIQYYITMIGKNDRRDTLWHWCTCLSKDNPCYRGNSHVKPLLQVLDDEGTFRGWVGVEASFNINPKLDPRSADMLGVFRAIAP